MVNLHKSMEPGRIELATPGSAVRLASVARHVTDCATRPGRTLDQDFCCFYPCEIIISHILVLARGKDKA